MPDAPAPADPVAQIEPELEPATVPEAPPAPEPIAVEAVPAPYLPAEPGPKASRGWILPAAIAALLLLAAAAAIAFIGLDNIRSRLGMAGRGSSISLLLQVPRTPERRRLASGNELFALTGRIVNPTRERQTVPDIQAELQDAQGRIVYSWIITPPARTLAPGASAEFDAAEVDVPKGAQELKLSFVGART